MGEPTIDRRMMVFSASNALDALGRAIHEIKAEDGLTWDDIGAVFGVSADQAAKYASGFATMSAITFLRGKREWNGRFTGYADRLVMNSRPGTVSGHMAMSHMLSATSAICCAMEDGELTAKEIRDNRSLLETARDELDALLRQIEVRAA